MRRFIFIKELALENLLFCLGCNGPLQEGEKVILAEGHIKTAYHPNCYATAQNPMFSTEVRITYRTGS
ncbi:MAG: hypothetical protein ACE5ES_01110 [Candidatus Nanoarchaeia archaeon]